MDGWIASLFVLLTVCTAARMYRTERRYCGRCVRAELWDDGRCYGLRHSDSSADNEPVELGRPSVNKDVTVPRRKERLVRHLFNSSNYSPLIRPARKPGDTVTTTFALYLSQLISVGWVDYRLAWQKEDFDHLEAIRVPASVVWKPDIVLFNNKDGQFDVALHSNVIVYNTGDCYWLPPAIFQSSCSIDVRQFP
ncbi:Neuronal acetylcholine receptor subunit beta-4, partial [Branchiostoma belcheri]